MPITTTHFKFHKDEYGLTRGCTITVHFARREMIPAYVQAHRDDPKTVDIYVSEDCVIAEVGLR